MTTERPAGGDGDALATAAGPIFAESSTERRIPRGWVASWALWDAGGAAFNAVITTFVFTVYLTSSYFISPGWSRRKTRRRTPPARRTTR
ncbi:hypothetical protein [Streptomyces sp. L7]|uniref:hypothetical protein n=1 Tax=Streptomyces sp. L7 TaxID=3423954 RepID=UPI003D958B2C